MTKRRKKKQPKRLSPQGLVGFTRDQVALGMVSGAGPAMIGFMPAFPGQAGVMQAMTPLRAVPQIHAAGYFIGAAGEMGELAVPKKTRKSKKKRKKRKR
jgi:hypothetical protein